MGEEEVHAIVIVGGGICGLTTALALHRCVHLLAQLIYPSPNDLSSSAQWDACRKGIASLVLEKSETLRANGAAIGVHANGWRVLEQLGVAAEFRETADLITG